MRDAPDLAKLFIASWRGGYRGILPDVVIDALDVRQITDLLQVHLAMPRQIAIVAVDDAGAIVGFTRVGDDPDDARRGQILSLYVAPEVGGGGIGRTLLEQGLDALARRGQRDVTLWIFSGNDRARHLYESFGFVPDGTHRVEAQFKTEEIRMVRSNAVIGSALPSDRTRRARSHSQ
jgi:ribosomal protein S18 acetylase RimI-like enzyme